MNWIIKKMISYNSNILQQYITDTCRNCYCKFFF